MIALGLVQAAADTGSGVSLSSAQIIIATLGTLGLGSVLAAVVNGFWTRKKLGADATEIITKAASGVVENVTADNARLRIDLDAEKLARIADRERADQQRREDAAEFRRVIDLHTQALQEHAAWDHLAYERLLEAGIDGLPEPPPLYHADASPRGVLTRIEDRA